MIPYGRQHIDQRDIDAVVEVLTSDFLTQGPCVPAFERALARRVGAKHCIAVNSATSALHLACLALGVGPGDRVWTTPITFVATANCARYCGAQVEFVDIEPDTGNLCVNDLKTRLKQADRENRLPKVIIPVHLCGQPCDLEEIHELSQRFGVRIIEDASHAIGATYHGSPVGSGRYSDITIFSFHPVKMITTGEGGAACTNDARLAQAMMDLRSHGIVRDSNRLLAPEDGDWYYEQQALGFNYRMTDLQAALGLSQLEKLDQFLDRREYLAQRYNRLLDDLAIQPLAERDDRYSSRHLYIIRNPAVRTIAAKRDYFEALRLSGVGVQVHYIPVYRQPDYRAHLKADVSKRYPGSEQYYLQAISLPLYVDLNDSLQDQVVDVLHKVALDG